jgi:hypothetical protein
MSEEPEVRNSMGKAATPAARKKAYRRPGVRVLGAVRLMTRGTGSMNGDAGQTMMVPSDRMLKENVVRIGAHPLGIGLYQFVYRPVRTAFGRGRQFGVMADEVEAVLPEAVSVHPDGYKVVDYAMLGISRPAA